MTVECESCGRSFKGAGGLDYHRSWCKGPSPAHGTRARDVRVEKPASSPELIVHSPDYPRGRVSGGTTWDLVDRIQSQAQAQAEPKPVPKPGLFDHWGVVGGHHRKTVLEVPPAAPAYVSPESLSSLGWNGRLRRAIGRNDRDRRRSFGFLK